MTTRLPSPLATARERVGLSQESLAELLTVERSTIGRWERGKRLPQPLHRRKLADALHLTLPELDEMLRPVGRRVGAEEPGGTSGVVHAAIPVSVAPSTASDYQTTAPPVTRSTCSVTSPE